MWYIWYIGWWVALVWGLAYSGVWGVWYGAKTVFIALFSLFLFSINRDAYCGEQHVQCCAVLYIHVLYVYT